MPCIGQSVTFDFCDAYLLHSNLGGRGPDASAPESIRYVNVARVANPEGGEKPGLSYVASNVAMDYEAARAHCLSLGGIIAVPRSEAERQAIFDARSDDSGHWLGFKLPKNEDILSPYSKYMGEDGTAMSYNYWHHSEPSGEPRDWDRYVWMEPTTGLWLMGTQSGGFKTVCQRKP